MQECVGLSLAKTHKLEASQTDPVENEAALWALSDRDRARFLNSQSNDFKQQVNIKKKARMENSET